MTACAVHAKEVCIGNCMEWTHSQCFQGAKDEDMDMDVDDEPMRIVRNYQRHDAR